LKKKINFKRRILTLDELCELQCPILVDTCIFSPTSPFRPEKDPESFEQLFLDKIRNKGNFYITQEVLKELGDAYDPRKNNPYAKEKNDKHFAFMQGMINLGRVLTLKNEETTSLNYYKRKNDVIRRLWNLSPEDYDLLMTGLTLIYSNATLEDTKRKVIILSDDTGIHNAHDSLLAKLEIGQRRFPSYFRSSLTEFEPYIPANHYVKAPVGLQVKN
jgi:hypothetical protein